MKKGKRGPVRIRRNIQQFGDPYLPDIDPGEIAVCTGCHAIFRRRHWFFDDVLYESVSKKSETHRVVCPACQKIRHGFFEGEVTLAPGTFLTEHKEEILNLIHNEEVRAKGFNPLERILSITEENGKIQVKTTNEKLTQRIGRLLGKAYQGKTEYHWSEDTKLLRVTWARV